VRPRVCPGVMEVPGRDDRVVLVDTLTTADEAEALARWIELHHRNLATIYVTHMHIDHYGGLSDFGRLKESASSEHELYDAMTELYPGWASHQTWLMFGLG
jgi:glyoxylase-like metal-dependent hydrolase (beta-lactamase superfamily II)